MIILIGTFPPPVHGAAAVTQKVSEMLVADKVPVLLCDTSPGPGTGRLQYHLNRVLGYVRSGLAIVRSAGKTAEPTAVYLCLSGGFGLLYDFMMVALARLKRCDVIFHHHSFNYITKRSSIMNAIIRLAGARQLHVTLCSNMAGKLTELYDPLLRTEVVSNLAFIDALDINRGSAGRGLGAIGYLSNISFGKGIDRFLDLMAELRAKGSRLVGRIAGPFDNEDVKKYVETRIREIGGIEYIGPVYGDNKSAFLSSIDLLVFPTRYLHEAQPLVVYEAQAAGVVVSASDRGCISQMVPAGLLLDSCASDLTGIAGHILGWETRPELFLPVVQENQSRRRGLVEQQVTDSLRFRDIFSTYK